MLYIDTATRAELLDAIYSDLSLADFFVQRNLDPENMTDEAIREQCVAWIEAGDETAAC